MRRAFHDSFVPSVGLATLGLALGFAGAARSDVPLPAGSLIIPMQSSFQDGCGTVSAYGLVLKTLMANDWIEAQGKTRITIHWVYSPDKAASGHVVPTNSLQPPSYPGQTSPAWNDPRWNDGVDFVVQNTAGVPVMQIVNSTGTDPTTDKTLATFDTTAAGRFPYTTAGLGPSLAYPNFPSAIVAYDAASPPCSAPALSTGCNASVVQYGGSAFVISASDAPNFLALLQGTLTATDSSRTPIDFAPFRTQAACDMARNQSPYLGGAANAAQFVGGGANEHYVWIHRAMTTFSVPNDVKINAPPPRIGLLQTIDGVAGGGVSGDMLPAYLASAGLSGPGAAGCAPGSYDAARAPGNCPQLGRGQIYDVLDVHDFESGFIRNLDSNGNPLYQVLWTPHWEGTPFGSCNQACIDKALKNVSSFLDNVNSKGAVNQSTTPGLMAECASVGVYDGVSSGAPYGWLYDANPLDLSQFASCVQGQVGACGVAATAEGLSQGNPPFGTQLPNCRDPDSVTGQACLAFDPGTAGAGDQFAQIGDFTWVSETGLLTTYSPNPVANSIYKPGFKPLAYGVNRLPTGGTPALRADATMDNFSYIRKDGDPTKGQIIYLGGHTYQFDVAGTRIVLNTILSLGQVRSGSETGYSGPTLYSTPTATLAYAATYNRLTAAGPPEARSFTASLGSSFIFPYHEGFLRGHDLTGAGALANGDNAFTANLDGDSFAANTLAARGPSARNIFTYLGGGVVANPFLGGSKTAPNGVLQVGWRPVDIDASSVAYAGSSCTGLDAAHIGPIAANLALNKPGPYAGMPGGGNTVCDLQEALALTITAADLGRDQGASEQAAIAAKLKQPSEILKAQELLQMVRGYCYATTTLVDGTGADVPHPSDADCNKLGSLRGAYPSQQRSGQPNKPYLGAFIHSKPVIVSASPLVADAPGAPAAKHRPTVAYVGGLDGMLHAFYVPSDGADAGYTGPAEPGLSWANPGASSAFVGHTPFAGAPFAPPAALTELWAFVPPGQLPLLQTNSAAVDATPSVIDAFGDFDGSGVRKWHTVLVASTGGSNRELFALDVTNPLNPVLLWDIASSQIGGLPYATQLLSDDDTGLDRATQTQSFSWQNRCRTGDKKCTPASFLLPPSSDGGRSVSGPYNYLHLGAGLKVTTGYFRRNNIPVFAAFVSTNEPGGNGLYAFAVDVVTGQKIWEFSNPYDTVGGPPGMRAGLGNTPPPGVALFSTANTTQIDRVYLGGDDGYLFELDAADGVNLSAYATALGLPASSATYALSSAFGSGDKWAQPISTQPTVFQVTFPLPGTSALQAYQGRPMIAYGTAGTDTVASIKTPAGQLVNGAVHLVPLDATGRYQPTDLRGNPALQSQVATNGVGKEAAGFPLLLTGGERLYGRIVVASGGSGTLPLSLPSVLPPSGAVGDQLFFATTTGTVTDIDQRIGLSGSTRQVDLKASTAGTMVQLASAGGAGGEVGLAVDAKGNVTKIITITDRTINVQPAGSLRLAPNGINGSGKPPTSLVGWFFRSLGPHGYGY